MSPLSTNFFFQVFTVLKKLGNYKRAVKENEKKKCLYSVRKSIKMHIDVYKRYFFLFLAIPWNPKIRVCVEENYNVMTYVIFKYISPNLAPPAKESLCHNKVLKSFFWMVYIECIIIVILSHKVRTCAHVYGEKKKYMQLQSCLV